MADRTVQLRTRALSASSSSGGSAPAKKESFLSKLLPNVLRDQLVEMMQNGDHWAVEILQDGEPYILVELQQADKKSSFVPVYADPKNFREPQGVIGDLVRRFSGETDCTNKQIIKIGNKTIKKQPKYRLFSSNCQRFATLVGHEILNDTSFEFDLIYGSHMTAQAESNIEDDGKGK